MDCKHENIVRLSDGWFCPDCGQRFAEKPQPPEVKPEAKPKRKRASKSAEK